MVAIQQTLKDVTAVRVTLEESEEPNVGPLHFIEGMEGTAFPIMVESFYGDTGSGRRLPHHSTVFCVCLNGAVALRHGGGVGADVMMVAGEVASFPSGVDGLAEARADKTLAVMVTRFGVNGEVVHYPALDQNIARVPAFNRRQLGGSPKRGLPAAAHVYLTPHDKLAEHPRDELTVYIVLSGRGAYNAGRAGSFELLEGSVLLVQSGVEGWMSTGDSHLSFVAYRGG